MRLSGKRSVARKPGLANTVILCITMTLLPAALLAEKPAADPDSKRLEQLQKRISKLRQVLKKARTQKSQVQSDLQRMDKSIGRINRKL